MAIKESNVHKDTTIFAGGAAWGEEGLERRGEVKPAQLWGRLLLVVRAHVSPGPIELIRGCFKAYLAVVSGCAHPSSPYLGFLSAAEGIRNEKSKPHDVLFLPTVTLVTAQKNLL